MLQPPIVKKIDHLGPLAIPLHGLHALTLSYGEENFAQRGECPPTFVISVGTDVLWLEARWSSWQEREIYFAAMRTLIRGLKARSYSFISEVWVVAAKSEEEADQLSLVSFAELPENKRDEMLLIDSWDRSGGHLDSKYLINSKRRSGLPFLGPRIDGDFQDADSFTGRAVNLFYQGG